MLSFVLLRPTLHSILVCIACTYLIMCLCSSLKCPECSAAVQRVSKTDDKRKLLVPWNGCGPAPEKNNKQAVANAIKGVQQLVDLSQVRWLQYVTHLPFAYDGIDCQMAWCGGAADRQPAIVPTFFVCHAALKSHTSSLSTTVSNINTHTILDGCTLSTYCRNKHKQHC